MAPPNIGAIDVTPMDSLNIEWKIGNFSSLSKLYYASPIFFFGGASWSINIYPNGHTVTKDYISLYLYRKSGCGPTNLEFSLSFKTLFGKYFAVKHFKEVFTSSECEFGDTRHVPKKELYSRILELLPCDILTVLCSVKCLKITEDIAENSPSTSGTSIAGSKKQVLFSEIGVDCDLRSFISPHDSKVLHDLKKLFLNKEDCDVVMKVRGQEFLAHRNILKARSPVFASTFRSEMKEKATGVIEIEDCDPTSFSYFLCFLYCGEVKNLSKENVLSLFFTADKYDVQDLREKCVEFLKENLSVDIFCDTISLGLKHSEAELVKLAADFFTKNAPNIVLSEKWQSFLIENPLESNKLLVKLLVPNTSSDSSN